MAPARLAERNVRPRPSVDDHVDYGAEDSDDEVSQDEVNGDISSDADENVSALEGDDGSDDGGDFQQKISQTSFGTLKQAQDQLSRKRKRGSDENQDQEEKLAALRSRLHDLKKKSQGKTQQTKPTTHAAAERATDLDAAGDSDSDEAPSEEEAPTKSRSSKHAPAAQSTKYQVSRKRNVIVVPKDQSRDPRFDAIHHQDNKIVDNNERAYAFINDYQKSEIKELRAAIKASKSEDDRETLRRKMVAMENRLKSKAAKERERDVVRKHRKEEKERVDQGKQPYYLKQKEIKEQALEEKFKGMKGKDREKAVERRRKKEGQKEKKRMPLARRV